MIGYGAAFAGTLLTASNFVCMRRLRNVHFSVLIFAFSVMSAIMSAAMIPIFSEYKLPQTTEEWTYALFVGIFGLLGQSLLAVALKYVPIFIMFPEILLKNSMIRSFPKIIFTRDILHR